jgi:hypothetical protein
MTLSVQTKQQETQQLDGGHSIQQLCCNQAASTTRQAV